MTLPNDPRYTVQTRTEKGWVDGFCGTYQPALEEFSRLAKFFNEIRMVMTLPGKPPKTVKHNRKPEVARR